MEVLKRIINKHTSFSLGTLFAFVIMTGVTACNSCNTQPNTEGKLVLTTAEESITDFGPNRQDPKDQNRNVELGVQLADESKTSNQAAIYANYNLRVNIVNGAGSITCTGYDNQGNSVIYTFKNEQKEDEREKRLDSFIKEAANKNGTLEPTQSEEKITFTFVPADTDQSMKVRFELREVNPQNAVVDSQEVTWFAYTESEDKNNKEKEDENKGAEGEEEQKTEKGNQVNEYLDNTLLPRKERAIEQIINQEAQARNLSEDDKKILDQRLRDALDTEMKKEEFQAEIVAAKEPLEAGNMEELQRRLNLVLNIALNKALAAVGIAQPVNLATGATASEAETQEGEAASTKHTLEGETEKAEQPVEESGAEEVEQPAKKNEEERKEGKEAEIEDAKRIAEKARREVAEAEAKAVLDIKKEFEEQELLYKQALDNKDIPAANGILKKLNELIEAADKHLPNMQGNDAKELANKIITELKKATSVAAALENIYTAEVLLKGTIQAFKEYVGETEKEDFKVSRGHRDKIQTALTNVRNQAEGVQNVDAKLVAEAILTEAEELAKNAIVSYNEANSSHQLKAIK